jgi:hypothetical protein
MQRAELNPGAALLRTLADRPNGDRVAPGSNSAHPIAPKPFPRRIRRHRALPEVPFRHYPIDVRPSLTGLPRPPYIRASLPR